MRGADGGIVLLRNKRKVWGEGRLDSSSSIPVYFQGLRSVCLRSTVLCFDDNIALFLPTACR